jgi:hypothetical protein
MSRTSRVHFSKRQQTVMTTTGAMSMKPADSFFYIPDTGRDPAKPPRYFVASPDDEDGNYGINAVFNNKAEADAYIAEFADTLYLFLLVEVLDATTETS